jgi:acylphosphatase
MEIAAHIVVKGMVQGVGFRYFVFNKASQFGLKGFVSNLHNGNVEIVVEGDRSFIEELIDEVKVGPRAASVRDVNVEWIKPAHCFHDFDVR